MTPARGWRRLVQLPTRRSIDDAVAREVEFHLVARAEALIAGGVAPREARARAEQEFGDVVAARRELAALDRRREAWVGWRAAHDALRVDLRFALRGIRRSPWLSLTVVGTLALGIGANATMFGIVDRIMLRPAPHVQNTDRLRQVGYRGREDGEEWRSSGLSYPDLGAFRAESTMIADAAGITSAFVSLGRGEHARKVRAFASTASLFGMTGVRPALGRFFSEDEDSPHAGRALVVLSHHLWIQDFAGDTSVLGRTMELLGRPFTIIGVAPTGFRGFGVERVDVFVPLSVFATATRRAGWSTDADWYWLEVFVSLRDGVSEEAAEQRLTPVFRRTHAGDGYAKDAEATLASVIPGRGLDASAADRVSVWLLGVAAIVLLIAVTNVANLLLTRASRRRRETAVRLAMGISRGRLVRQLVGESVLLATIGALAAVVVARIGGAVVRAVLLPDLAPDDALIDVRVFVFAAVLALLCGVATGLAPALFARRVDLTSGLKLGEREGGGRHSRIQLGLLVGQSAMALVLVLGAVLFVGSLRNALAEELGYDARRVLVATMALSSVGYDSVAEAEFWEVARERVAAIPGVESTGLTVATPFRTAMAVGLRVEGTTADPDFDDGGPYHNSVSNSFFEVAGMRMVEGRGFSPSDRRGAPRVAVVSETMARAYWPGQSALGKCIFVGPEWNTGAPCSTIVGVVRDGRRYSIRQRRSAQYYVSLDQDTWRPLGERSLMIRTARDPAQLGPIITRALQSIRPNVPYAEVQVMQSLLDGQIRPWRLGATLFVVFGALALLIASLGLFSVLSYQTSQRTRELGVRVALGARANHLAALVLARGLGSAGLGIMIGLAVTVALGRQLEPMLFDVSPYDVRLLGAAVLGLLVVAVAACVMPALRAARVDPVRALKAE